ncbi:hypothetical protein H102_08461 [Trichophyton rubrum CBS 100081]|nr:hypothetical protein H102_08461 [Trichophyton rubrum CBS 100081]
MLPKSYLLDNILKSGYGSYLPRSIITFDLAPVCLCPLNEYDQFNSGTSDKPQVLIDIQPRPDCDRPVSMTAVGKSEVLNLSLGPRTWVPSLYYVQESGHNHAK